jgi:histidine ammonia-lyase
VTVILSERRDLTLDAARRVGWEGEGVSIAAHALERVALAREAFERLIADPDVTIYGVTSGYGQNARIRLESHERLAHARRPQSAIQANSGNPFPERVVRLMAFARLANFIEGHAAVRPKVAEAVAAMLSNGKMPTVPMDGALCAGEILPLGWLFADLTARLEPLEKEALALINGAPVAAALASDGAIAGERRLSMVEALLALAAEAYRVPTAHFSPEVSALSGDPHELAAAQSLSSLIGRGTAERRPYQAPVSFRILPKMLGRLRRALAELVDVASLSLTQVSDNPVFLAPDAEHPGGRCVSTGGYHNALAWPALNALATACADLCTIADRLIARLLDGSTSFLPDQLMDEGEQGLYLGTLGFAVVGYGEQARRAAQSVFLPGSESGGFVQNDVAVPTVLAWQGAMTAGSMLDRALASLSLVATQALVVTGRRPPPALRAALADLPLPQTSLDKVTASGGRVAEIAASIERCIFSRSTLPLK